MIRTCISNVTDMEYTTAGDKYFGENPPDFRMWSSSDVCDYFTKYFNDDVVKLFRKEVSPYNLCFSYKYS